MHDGCSHADSVSFIPVCAVGVARCRGPCGGEDNGDAHWKERGELSHQKPHMSFNCCCLLDKGRLHLIAVSNLAPDCDGQEDA